MIIVGFMKGGIDRIKSVKQRNCTRGTNNLNWLLLKVYCEYRVDASAKNVMLILEKMIDSTETKIITDEYRLENYLKYLVGCVLNFTIHGRINIGFRSKGSRVEFYISSPCTGTIMDYKDLISGLSYSTVWDRDEAYEHCSGCEKVQVLKIRAERRNEWLMLVSDPECGSEITLSVGEIER